MSNKILIIRLSSLGDVVLTAPVYKNLKAHWPDCTVSVLVKPAFAGIVAGMPGVDEVIAFTGLRSVLRRIRQSGFTHLLDLHANLRSLIIRRLCGIPCVSVYRKDALARRLFVFLGLPSPALERHNVERYLAALKAWKIPIRKRWVSLGDYGVSAAAVDRAGQRVPVAHCPRHVIILQSAFLGDSLLTLPLARDLKGILPGCRITVLTLPKSATLFQNASYVDEVIIDDKRGAHQGLSGMWRLAKHLKSRGFDLALIPHRSLRSALLAYLAAVPRRIGFASSAGRALLTDAVPFTWLMHDLERNLALLQPLKPDIRTRPDESIYVDRDHGATEAINLRLAQAGVSAQARIIGVHPGSAWPTKRWLPRRFGELCRRLRDEGFQVVLVGGENDRELCGRISQASGALDWAGRTDLVELKAVMGRMALFVTNDSGPMHMATALGIPTLAIFGPTTRELGFFPYGSGHRVLEAELACRPCSLHGTRTCPAGHFLCMRLITTDMVFARALDMTRAMSLA
ncbi:MAG TPA: lipopolysaccharide heptosyltransferase II [Elusimicrobia bacterium]|nr:lipopolysaccharide heptosyltransferase II [Elusimicrobiota bacterium]HBT62711.1 lipopolysaccharide heptosyltransferase II [Elusimicrobiota bacterium]